MTAVYVGLGGNVGAPARAIRDAAAAIARLPATRLRALSPLYATAPIGCIGAQPDFVNAVARAQTALPPRQFWQHLREIEAQFQRRPRAKNRPRRLDVDLLLFGNARILSRGLIVPHPKLPRRAFVLRPLLDILPADDRRRPTLVAAARRCATQKIARL